MRNVERYVCDISDYQAEFSARHYRRAGRRAIMIKACEDVGKGGALLHHSRAHEAHMEGLRVIHYGFLRPGSGKAQGHYLVSQVSDVWRDGDVLCADIEDTSLSAQAAAVLLNEWKAALSSQGHREPIGYSGCSYLRERGLGKLLPHGWIVAEYGTLRRAMGVDIAAAGGVCLGRQFTDGELGPGPHTCSGISGPVDCSYLTGEGVKRILEHR